MEKRERFLFWEKCRVCRKWKLSKRLRWTFNGKDMEYWEAECRACRKEGESEELIVCEYCKQEIKSPIYLSKYLGSGAYFYYHTDCGKRRKEKEAVLKYILSLGWQDTDNEYVKEVLEDAERITRELSKLTNK